MYLCIFVPIVIHGPMKVLDIWVMSSHDVVIKVRQEVRNDNPGVVLHMWMVWAEHHNGHTEMNSGTGTVTRLPGILTIGPQVTAVAIS